MILFGFFDVFRNSRLPQIWSEQRKHHTSCPPPPSSRLCCLGWWGTKERFANGAAGKSPADRLGTFGGSSPAISGGVPTANFFWTPITLQGPFPPPGRVMRLKNKKKRVAGAPLLPGREVVPGVGRCGGGPQPGVRPPAGAACVPAPATLLSIHRCID